MSYQFHVNQTPTNGAEAMFIFKTRAKLAGFTVPASSDGLTYNSSGDQITGFGTGAGGMANNSAWFILQAPDGIRQWVFQRGNTNPAWRIKYSASAKFTGGTPSATRVPSATDEGTALHGSGTDASPTYANLFNTDGSYRFHMMFDNAAPYGWYAVAYPVGGFSGTSGLVVMLFDPLTNTDALDVDPCINYISPTNETGGGLGLGSFGVAASAPWGWLKKGMAGEGFVRIPAATYAIGNSAVVPSGLPSNPHSGKDDAFPVIYLRATSAGVPAGYKGVSSLVRWRATDRGTGQTGTVTDPKDRIVVNKCQLPWDKTSDPLL